MEVGVTYVTDETGGAESELSGVDLRWQINEQTLFKAEFAESNSIIAGVDQNGGAHLIEFEYNGEKSSVRAFIREVDDEFGLGYQSAADKDSAESASRHAGGSMISGRSRARPLGNRMSKPATSATSRFPEFAMSAIPSVRRSG